MGIDNDDQVESQSIKTTHVRPRCFMDVAVDNILLGRIIFELFDDFCPLTCENFRALCTGEKGLGKTTGKLLHYQGVIFHRVVKSFMVQCGDFSAGNGTGGESIFGGTFPDENFDLKHDQPFLLSMANRGPDTNGSQFFITTQPTPHLDGIHVVFGRVVSGQPVVMQIEELGVDKNSRPLQDAKVVKSGELVLKSKTKRFEKSASESETSSSDDDKKRRKKKKKKEKESKRKSSKKFERSKNEDEDAEPVGQLHPLVSVSNIDPEEIPAGPPNRFLSRGGPSSMFLMKPQIDADDRPKRRNRIRGVTKSGRIVKGRGTLRFRTPSRSRSKSYTPPHWRQEQKKMITFNEFEKKEIERKEREEEIKRREEARKKRHEEKEKLEKDKDGGDTPPGTPPKGFKKQNDKMEIDMMAKIEDVFQIIRDRNIKNGMENQYDGKNTDQRTYDIKKKDRGDIKEKIQKFERKSDRRSRSRSLKHRYDDRSPKHRYDDRSPKHRYDDRSPKHRYDDRSPKHRYDDRSHRDRGQRDGNRYARDNRDNRYTRKDKKNHSKDKEHSNKKKKDNPRSNSSSSDHKSKQKIRNGNSFSLSPEEKD